MAKLTVVLPVRDGENRIADRVTRVLDALVKLTRQPSEVLVVNDGSQDGTAEILEDLREIYPQVRVVSHGRPRGMEAAGQTGLERATGELVFIQESDANIRVEDLRRLLHMAEDASVVAARAESRPEPIAPELLRRLRAWGTDADRQVTAKGTRSNTSSIQMIRRPHLQRLAGPKGDRYRLSSETERVTSVAKRS